jgi:hypothetical protein
MNSFKIALAERIDSKTNWPSGDAMIPDEKSPEFCSRLDKVDRDNIFELVEAL